MPTNRTNQARNPIRAFVRLATRACLTAGVVWMAWSTYTSLGWWGRRAFSPLGKQVAKAEIPLPLLPDLLAHQPGEGYWTFAGWPWRFAARERADDHAGLLDQSSQLLAVTSPGRATAEERDLIAAIERLPFNRRKVGNRLIYSLDTPTARFGIVVGESIGEPRLLGGSAALRISPTSWRVYELLRSDQHAIPHRATLTEHLLPLPAEASQIMARWSADDRLQLEIANLSVTRQELLSGWQSAGWTVQRGAAAEAPTIDIILSLADEHVYVWSGDQGDTIERLIMARLPNHNPGSFPANQSN